MASIIPQDVIEEEFLLCSLCSGKYTSPKLLPCLHTYCLPCLDAYVSRCSKDGKFKCPQCCVLLMVPERGVGAFKTNTFVASLQDIVESQSNRDRGCDNCLNPQNPAKYHCLDCKTSLCLVCKDAHHWLKVTKGHRIATVGELQSGKFQSELQKRQTVQCEVHPDNPLTCICLSCDRGVCQQCQLTTHNGHRLGDFKQAAARDRSLIRSLCDAVREQETAFENSLNMIDNYIGQCSQTKERVLEKLEQHRSHLHEVIDQCFEELTRQIEEAYAEEQRLKDIRRREIKAIMSAMQHQQDFTSKLLKHGKDQDLITMGKILKVSLNNYSFLPPPSIDTKLEIMHKPPKIDQGLLLPMFGRIVKKQIPVTQPNNNPRTDMIQEVRQRSKHATSITKSFNAKTDLDDKGCKPTALTLTPDDNIVLVDDINKKLKVFDSEGNFQYEIFPQGQYALIDPWDVAITKSGNLAVTDKGAHDVKIFTTNGNFVRSFGPHLRCPWGIAVNSKGHIIVTDPAAQCIFIHEGESGKVLFTLECGDQSSMFLCPEYVTTNLNDDIIISDFDRHCIMVFDSQGRFLYRYGTKGKAMHEFNVPCGLGTDKLGNIFVTDYSNQRLHLITLDGQFKCFALTREDSILTPQDVAVNSKGQLVVVDGTTIKIFAFQDARLSERAVLDHYSMAYDGVKFKGNSSANESEI